MPRRLSTGCEGLDEILCGGLHPSRSYLLVGSAGTGKTILSLQYLRDGLRRGERTVYITLAEPAGQIAHNVAGLGWDLKGIDLVDMTPAAVNDTSTGEEYRMFSPSEVERVNVWKGIYDTVEQRRPTRLVIDSATQLRYLSTDDFHFRKHVLRLMTFLNRHGCTTLLAYEPAEMEAEKSLELTADGVLRLRFQVSAGLALGLRSVEVTKLRGSDFLSGYHPFRIGENGFTAYPHRIEHAAENGAVRRRIASGIQALDELLGGGLETGTTTLLSGPAGVGKTTLGTQFLLRSAPGERAALLTFEESRDSVLQRSRGLGLPIDAALDSGELLIQRINPLELYPDELLALVRELVEKRQVRHLMIDSLRGYHLSMEEFGKPLAHVHNLLAYLNRNDVTTILISETEHITSATLTATDMGVSHLADNIVLLRYAEYRARIIKVIGCLKKRLGAFEAELRELRLTPAGIAVSAKLEGLRGILTGVPTTAELPA